MFRVPTPCLPVVALFIWTFLALHSAPINSAKAAAPLYTITDITPIGYTSSMAFDINSSGDAVGIASRFAPSFEEVFFFYDHSAGTSTPIGIGTVQPRSSIVSSSGFSRAAINDSGQIAGTARFLGPGPTESRGFIYSGGIAGSFTNLGTFVPTGVRPSSDALDINDSGVATGTATSGAGTTPQENDNIDAYIGSASPITDIDGDVTVATRRDFGRAINNAGLVVGSNESGVAASFTTTTETAFLSGTSLSGVGSTAHDLNEVGQITGDTLTSTSYIYDTTDSSLRILPNLGTGARVAAKSINESGDVVGVGDRGPGLSDQGRGFVHIHADNASYLLEDHIVDLTFPAGTNPGNWTELRTAWGINDSGWIVGQGFRRFDGAGFPNQRAYLLVPSTIPEPSTVALLLLATISLSTYRRR